MKKDVIGRVLSIIIISIFLLSGIFSAPPAEGTCGVVLKADCDATDGSEGYIVMGMSAAKNAHGEFPHVNYPYVLCCNFGDGDITDCKEDPTKKIIKLSSPTNAHAQEPGLTTYSTKVCYEDMECIGTTSNCGDVGSDAENYPLEILSLSAPTNAHIGSFSDYSSTKICCGSVLASQSTCSLESAHWSFEEAEEGQKVYLEVIGGGTECLGGGVSFEIWEKDLVNDDLLPSEYFPSNAGFVEEETNIIARGKWFAKWTYEGDDDIGDDERTYYFIASVINYPEQTIPSSNELEVAERDSDFCTNINNCEDYGDDENSCNSDDEDNENDCGAAEGSSLPDINCDSDEIFCGCYWHEEECKFGYTIIGDCGDAISGCNYGCTLCDNPTTGLYCAIGVTCPTDETPLGNNDGICDFGIDGCLSDDCSDGQQDTCSPGTYCMAEKCYSAEGPSVSFGNCKITQKIKTNCTEGGGVKTINITTTWEGDTSEIGYQKCIELNGKTTDVSCPAQIQLPFFDYMEMIITSIIIAGVYILLILKSKLRKVKKGRTKN